MPEPDQQRKGVRQGYDAVRIDRHSQIDHANGQGKGRADSQKPRRFRLFQHPNPFIGSPPFLKYAGCQSEQGQLLLRSSAFPTTKIPPKRSDPTSTVQSLAAAVGSK